MTVATPGHGRDPGLRARPRLSYFFPAHNEEANLEGLVLEALETLPRDRRTRSRSSPSTTARRTGRARSPTAWRPSTRASSGRSTTSATAAMAARCARASRRRATTSCASPTATASSGSPTSRGSRRGWPSPTRPDVVAGYRIKRADPFIRIAYARTYKLANRIFFGLRVRDVDCACKLFTAGLARRRPGRVGRRVLLGRAADQDPQPRPLDRRGRHPALPADRRLPDRRQAVGHRARREGLLGAAAAAVGEPRARAAGAAGRSWGPPRPRRPGPRGRLTHPARRIEGDGLARRAAAAALLVGVERVDELAEDVEPGHVDRLARLLEGASPTGSEPSPPSSSSSSSGDVAARSRTSVVAIDRGADPHRQRDRVRGPRVDLVAGVGADQQQAGRGRSRPRGR